MALIASGPFDLSGPRATTRSVIGGIGVSPGTRNNDPARSQSPAAPAVAEKHFRDALDWAHREGALSWELRTATSLAGLLTDRHRATEARELLGPVYDRLTEGFATADLQMAKNLLQQLG
ncbi:MAG: hypothetical protein WA709_06325 [Stellaceae bacterium]